MSDEYHASPRFGGDMDRNEVEIDLNKFMALLQEKSDLKDRIRELEDEKNDSDKDLSSNILILNQKVNSDGTIKLLQKDEDLNSEINDIIDQKLSYLVENKIEKILDEKIPKLLKNYFDSK